MYNQRLLDMYGEEACKNAWNNAARVGLRQSIWSKMWKAINNKETSYLKRVEFIVLKDMEYADKWDTVGYTSPAPSYFNIGRGAYKSVEEIKEMLGKGEIYPKILMDTVKECEDTKRLFELNKTGFEFQ